MADNESDNTSRDVHPVETVEDFKLRIAAIIRAKPEQIPTLPPPRAVKRVTNRKVKRRRIENTGKFKKW